MSPGARIVMGLAGAVSHTVGVPALQAWPWPTVDWDQLGIRMAPKVRQIPGELWQSFQKHAFSPCLDLRVNFEAVLQLQSHCG